MTPRVKTKIVETQADKMLLQVGGGVVVFSRWQPGNTYADFIFDYAKWRELSAMIEAEIVRQLAGGEGGEHDHN